MGEFEEVSVIAENSWKFSGDFGKFSNDPWWILGRSQKSSIPETAPAVGMAIYLCDMGRNYYASAVMNLFTDGSKFVLNSFADDCPNCVDEHSGSIAASRWTMPLLKLGEKQYYLGIFFKVIQAFISNTLNFCVQ